MERKQRRTVIDIETHQPALDFEEAENSPPFSFPEYQKEILFARFAADATDMLIVAGVYLIFIATTVLQMAEASIDRRVAGIYLAGYLIFVGVYYFLFMLSSSQTPGMKLRHLIVVTREGELLDSRAACMRGFGYIISIAPVMLGFIWAMIDPEHLTWADKVSGTFLKKT